MAEPAAAEEASPPAEALETTAAAESDEQLDHTMQEAHDAAAQPTGSALGHSASSEASAGEAAAPQEDAADREQSLALTEQQQQQDTPTGTADGTAEPATTAAAAAVPEGPETFSASAEACCSVDPASDPVDSSEAAQHPTEHGEAAADESAAADSVPAGDAAHAEPPADAAVEQPAQQQQQQDATPQERAGEAAEPASNSAGPDAASVVVLEAAGGPTSSEEPEKPPAAAAAEEPAVEGASAAEGAEEAPAAPVTSDSPTAAGAANSTEQPTAAASEAAGEAPAPAAPAAASSAAAEPMAAAAQAPADESAGAAASTERQPDKAYFVDGIRAIDVEVNCGAGIPCKLLHVTMDMSALQASTKPYLGGFKHKQTGAVFHHASIQTPQEKGATGSSSKQGHQQRLAPAQPRAGGGGMCGLDGQQQQQSEVCWPGQKLTRETQTVKEATSSCQTVREAATQMAAPGLLLDCSRDRVLTPRPYVSSAVVQQRREAAALTIQRFSRGWFARKRAAVLRGIKAERDAFLAETAAESAHATAEHRRREVERRTHPLSKADFVLLESELEAWRQQQTAAIKGAGLVTQEEQAALQLLLAKETRLLHTLDRLRTVAHRERRASGRQHTLGSLAQPKTWALSNGGKVLVHTPLTVRAAELQQLYRGITLTSLSLDERLDVLLHVKWVAKEWDSGATRELVELIDREADLLNRGRSPKTLDGLRKRIAGLFLTCCQNPAFNPEAARLRVNGGTAGSNSGPETFEYELA